MFDSNELIGIHCFSFLVPEQQFGIELVPSLASYMNVASQLPSLGWFVVECGVGFNTRVDAEESVELFKIYTFLECPIRRIDTVVD